MTTYTVVCEQAGDGSWSASSPDVPGCYSVGDTVDEAEAGMREALPERRSAVGTVTA
jgi:predicted RNase H-like HicB family nuclease